MPLDCNTLKKSAQRCERSSYIYDRYQQQPIVITLITQCFMGYTQS